MLWLSDDDCVVGLKPHAFNLPGSLLPVCALAEPRSGICSANRSRISLGSFAMRTSTRRGITFSPPQLCSRLRASRQRPRTKLSGARKPPLVICARSFSRPLHRASSLSVRAHARSLCDSAVLSSVVLYFLLLTVLFVKCSCFRLPPKCLRE